MLEPHKYNMEPKEQDAKEAEPCGGHLYRDVKHAKQVCVFGQGYVHIWYKSKEMYRDDKRCIQGSGSPVGRGGHVERGA